jgi:uncharacterized protein
VKNPLVIYHGGCRDGFCAAWVCSQVPELKDAEYFAGFYGQSPPTDVDGRSVVIVDFSYPRNILEQLADRCASLQILDHHKTAQEALEGFKHDKARIVFDMNRSGAGLTWDHYFPDQHRPWLVDYVEDRDLWRKKLTYTEEVNAFISTLEFGFDVWSAALELGLTVVCERGISVENKMRQYVREVSKNARRVTFEGYEVPLVNAPQVDISEVLDALRQGEKFAMGWWQRADGMYQYSLRSTGDFDVSALAKVHGGGGHKNAAGFQLPYFIFGSDT